jgi:uncharacterized protein (DUF1499 family)
MAMSFLIALLLVVVSVVLAARLGAFSGSAPSRLGVAEGKLKAPSKSPNSVSSQAALWPEHPQREYAAIAPLALRGDGPATIERLAQVIEAMPGAQLVERRPDYLYARFTTPWMRFIDDAEFWFDPSAGVVQVRSASRVGRKDFGVNRGRIEALRARLAVA